VTKSIPMATALLIAVGGLAARAADLPAGVRVQKNITYAKTSDHAAALKLDLYLPTGANGPLPVIVRIAPERESPQRPANELLAKGYALIYASYLPDDAAHTVAFTPFPADLQAAKAAIRWARGNATANGLDPVRIGIWGSDHGATIASLLAVTADQSDLNGTLGDFPALSSAVRAACLFGGTTDWRNAELYGDETVNLPGSPAYQLFQGNPKEHTDEARDASAVNYVRPTSPATLMVTLASDSNRAMHLIYAETLRRAGVASALYEEPAGSGAGLGGRAVDEAKLDRTIIAFFDDALRSTPPAKMSVQQEIDTLVQNGLYKQARRLIEEQVARASPNDRPHWLALSRQISDKQREPALNELAAAMKQRTVGRDTTWTIREVLTDPERIGQYQVEATPAQPVFDARANALHQVEILNAAVLQKEWSTADQQANILRNLAATAQADVRIANEFLSRYQRVRSDTDQLWPQGVQPIGFATAFGQDLYGFWFDLRAGGAVQRFRYIPPGTFDRGSSPSEWGRLPGEPLMVPTSIPQGFWLSDSPVTQQMWDGVMGTVEDHSHFHGPTLPADSVSYAHAVNFLAKLGVDARLPTESEWEYACRAGTRDPYAGTGRLSDEGWAWDEAKSGTATEGFRILNELPLDPSGVNRSTHDVKKKLPNAWGLYDMQGNVWEWCSGTSPEKPHDYHVVRGGSWISIPQDCRAAREAWFPIEEEAWNVGLRILVPAQTR
jgi:sulfatase modifying factor 1